MKNKINIITYTTIILAIINILFLTYNQNYKLTYINIIIISILLSLIIYFSGIIINKKDNYKKNINIYLSLYIVMLIIVTLLSGRLHLTLINKEYFNYYMKLFNIIPFKNIIEFLKGTEEITSIIYNLLGNMLLLVPLSYLLILKDKKYENTKLQFKIISSTSILIETLQLLLSCGIFDIDDYILNVSGALLFLLFYKKTNLKRINNLFFTSINIKKSIKYFVYIILTILTLYFNYYLINDYNTKTKDIIEKTYYVEETNKIRKIETTNYNIYLINVEVEYKSKYKMRMSLYQSLKKEYLTKEEIEKDFNFNNISTNDNMKIYKDDSQNITFVLCKNNDIYVGNKELNIDNNICSNK